MLLCCGVRVVIETHEVHDIVAYFDSGNRTIVDADAFVEVDIEPEHGAYNRRNGATVTDDTDYIIFLMQGDITINRRHYSLLEYVM